MVCRLIRSRFHLGNDAIIHAVHADADISENARSQSGGAMVNYLYDLRDVSQNHVAFVRTKDVAAIPDVQALAREAARARTDGR